MNRRFQSRLRQKEINTLYVQAKKRQSKKKQTQLLIWAGFAVIFLIAAGYGTHLAVNALLEHVLYQNPQYALKRIIIETKGDISQRQIRQAAGLSLGQNIWALNMVEIQHNIERLPYVAEARIEKHLPDKLVIRITERSPIVKVTGISSDLGTPETFYVDRDQFVLFKPRPGETMRPLPEITGLHNAEFEAGQHLEQPELLAAINLLKEMEITPLANTLDIRTIDLAQPLSLKVTTAQGAIIYFRLDYVSQQLQRLQEILNTAQQRNLQIATVDLTLDRNVPVTFMPVPTTTTARIN